MIEIDNKDLKELTVSDILKYYQEREKLLWNPDIETVYANLYEAQKAVAFAEIKNRKIEPTGNIPTEEGYHLWFDQENDNELLVMYVCDVGKDLGEKYLRVSYRGSYYNVAPDDFNEEVTLWPKKGWV